MTRVASVILAAGAARRMGRPKQLLPYRGRSLLRHAVDTARAADLDPVVVVLGASADRIAPELQGQPARAVHCGAWERGMGASIAAGVRALIADDPDAVVLLACDQPLLGADVLRQLCAAHAAGAEVVASAYAGTVGVPALFGRAWLPRLLDLDPERGAKGLLTAAGTTLWTVSFPGGAVDIDTPEEYERLHEVNQEAD